MKSMESESGARVRIAPDRERLTQALVEEFFSRLEQADRGRRELLVMLAGGSTPASFYRKLAEAGAAGRGDWSRVRFFFGDERCVPPDHADSNYAMAAEALLRPLSIPESQVVRFQVELGAEPAAHLYHESLCSLEPSGNVPTFDLVLLGMGSDGHVASLFPHSVALSERDRLAVAAGEGPDGLERVTVTFPVVNAAREVWLIVTGKEKAQAVRRLLEGSFDPDEFPVHRVRPTTGLFYCWIDAEAEGDGHG